MIWDSHFWKNDLLKQANQLRKRRDQRRWPEVSLARLEQTTMLGFYSVRKLIDASKLSDEVAQQHICLNVYPRSDGSNLTRWNWEQIDKHYDLTSKDTTNRNLLFLCNQFVHSYVFIPAFNDAGRLDGFYFSSDLERKVRLYSINIGKIIEVFDAVGNDYPSKTLYKFDPETKKQTIKNLR